MVHKILFARLLLPLLLLGSLAAEADESPHAAHATLQALPRGY